MTDRNIDEILSRLGDLATIAERFVDRTGYERHKKEEQEYLAKVKEANLKLAATISSLTNGAANLTKEFANGKGNFTSLNSVVNGLQSGLSAVQKGLVAIPGPWAKAAIVAIEGLNALGEAAKFAVEEFEKAYSTFEQLSDTGVVGRFEDLTSAANRMGLVVEDTSKVLSKYSKEISKLGSSTIAGRQRFEEVAYASTDVRKNFQKIGISMEQYNDYQLSYMDSLRLSGELDKKTTAEIVQGTGEYILKLDALSKLTGESREELKKKLDAEKSNIRSMSILAGMGQKAQQNLQAASSILGPTLGKALIDAVTGNFKSDEFKSAMVAYGHDFIDIANQVATQRLDPAGVVGKLQAQTNRYVNLMGKTTENSYSLAGILGDSSIATKALIDQYQLGARTQLDSMSSMADIAGKTTQERGTVNSNLGELRTNLYSLSRDIRATALSFESITKVSNWAAGAVASLGSSAAKVSGANLPPPPNIPAMPAGGGGGAAGAGAGAGVASPTPGAAVASARAGAVAAGNGPTADDLLKTHGLRFAKSPSQVHIDNAALSPKLIELAKKLPEITGYAGLTGLNDGYARGGSSAHSSGLALDFVINKNPPPTIEEGKLIVNQLEKLGASYAKDEYNYKSPGWTGPHFHAEVSALTGGIASGPYSGYPAKLHGNELIQPLAKNSILEKLATMPNNISNVSETQKTDFLDVIQSVKNMSNTLARGFSEMNRALIEIKSIQKTLMMRTYT